MFWYFGINILILICILFLILICIIICLLIYQYFDILMFWFLMFWPDLLHKEEFLKISGNLQRLWHKCFSVLFCEIFKSTYFSEHFSKRLLTTFLMKKKFFEFFFDSLFIFTCFWITETVNLLLLDIVVDQEGCCLSIFFIDATWCFLFLIIIITVFINPLSHTVVLEQDSLYMV